jgi:UrcA family protein
MKTFASTIIATLTLHALSPVAAAAAVPEDVRREVVRFAELDLTRPAGAQELYRRIQRAAHKVCGSYGPSGYDRSCADQAIARAVATVGAPLLRAHHEALAPRQPLEARQARLDR